MTDACNLSCPYCFANEFVNKDSNEITEENFDKAVSFIIGNGTRETIGLIGGEPTVHSQFGHLLRKLIENEQVKKIVVYTNGINVDRYINILSHPKVAILINCNSPADIGEKNFERLRKNIDLLVNEHLCKYKLTLGINMYKPDFDYDYIVQLLKDFDFKSVRVSVTVPNVDDGRNSDAHAYFLKMKPRVIEFFKTLLESGIVPFFDCNKIPSCLLSEDEVAMFKQYAEDPKTKEGVMKSNISNTKVRCSPVIDILQDLTAVRCFGLSLYTRQPIENFKTIDELNDFYLNSIDAYACNTAYSAKCIDCASRKNLQCMGGCIAFKIGNIQKMQAKAEELMKSTVNNGNKYGD